MQEVGLIPHEVGPYIFLSPFRHQIWIGINTQTHANVLIWVIRKDDSSQLLSKLTSELSVLRQIQHPLIARFHEMLEDDTFAYLVADPPQSQSLRDYVTNHGPVAEAHTQIFFSQFAEISKEFSHLGTISFIVSIDSVFVDDNCSLTQVYITLESSYVGIQFKSPEVIRGQPYSPASIIWTAGIFLYFMAVGSLPFDGPDERQIRRSILQSRLAIPDTVPDDLAVLITRMLTKNPVARLSMSAMLNQSWIARAPDCVREAFKKMDCSAYKQPARKRGSVGSVNSLKGASSSLADGLIRISPRRSYQARLPRPSSETLTSNSVITSSLLENVV
jgi:serine/threonine protein kinase